MAADPNLFFQKISFKVNNWKGCKRGLFARQIRQNYPMPKEVSQSTPDLNFIGLVEGQSIFNRRKSSVEWSKVKLDSHIIPKDKI